MKPKDYLGTENARNKEHAVMYQRLIEMAMGPCAVLVGHHLSLEFNGDINTENEIPSADTMIFDHAIMKEVFGDAAGVVMAALAAQPVEGGKRDALLADFMERVDKTLR
jgi:hypothetical protein